jgi:hypothetical protein
MVGIPSFGLHFDFLVVCCEPVGAPASRRYLDILLRPSERRRCSDRTVLKRGCWRRHRRKWFLQ